MTEREMFDIWWPNKKEVPTVVTSGYYTYETDLREVAWKVWQAARRWIPVSNDLPKKNESVLCTDGNNIFIADWNIWNGHVTWSSNGSEGEIVTHWQPLPEPPEDN